MTFTTTPPAARSPRAATSPAGAATHANARWGTMEDAFQRVEEGSYIEGFIAGRKSEQRYEKSGNLTDVCAWAALAFAAGLAIGLYIMAPAF